MINQVIDIWFNELKKPREKGKYSYSLIKDTNIIISKNYDNQFGLIITDTCKITDNFKLKYFDFSFKELFKTGKGVQYRRCQIMFAHENVNTDYLIKILFGVLEDKERPYTSKTLVRVLKELKTLFDPEEQNRNEVIGVWGELYLIDQLIDRRADKEVIQNIIDSWEGDGGRKKIDFRFSNSKITIEIKTTTEEQRIHHFSGFEQLMLPTGFENAYIASLRLVTDDGLSCFDLKTSILNKISDKSLSEFFEEKITIRGLGLCNDRYYRFTARDKNAFSLYNAQLIKTPSIHDGIIDVNWKQNLDLEVQIANTKVREIFRSIKGQ